MRWIVVVLVFLLLFLAACAPSGENLVGEGYSSLSNVQKQAFWSCWRSACDVPLQQAQRTNDYAAYRSCSLDCYDQGLKATQNVWCKDSDEGTSFFTSGVVTSNIYPQGKTDYCYTFPNSKTYLLEGICLNNKYAYVQKNCAELGAGWYCEPTMGTCVESSFPPTEISMQEIPVFNVKEFGAVADGTTNDGPAIQAALEKVAEVGEGKVFLPAGEYFVDQTLLIDNNTEIYGEGEKTILYRGSTPNFVPENSWVANTDTCNKTAAFFGTPLFWNREYNCGNENIKIHHLVVDGSKHTLAQLKPQHLGGGPMLAFSAMKDVVIESITVRHAPQDGIAFINGGVNITIQGNTVEDALRRYGNGGYINTEMHNKGNLHTTKEIPFRVINNTIIMTGPSFCHKGTPEESLKKICTSDTQCVGACGKPSEVVGIGATFSKIYGEHQNYPYMTIKDNTLKITNRHNAINCHFCRDSEISGNIITAGEIYPNLLSGLFTGIAANAVSSIKITDNQITGSGKKNDGRGILLYGGEDIEVRDNIVKNKQIQAGLAAIEISFAKNFIVKNNDIENVLGAFGLAVGACYSSPTSNGVVQGNTISQPGLTSNWRPLVARNIINITFSQNAVSPFSATEYNCLNQKYESLMEEKAQTSLQNAESFQVNKQPQVLNVLDFGAVPNDATPDAGAIQAAIDEARKQKTAVYLPAGTYLIDKQLEAGVFGYGNAFIRVAGEPGKTILKAVQKMDSVLHINIGATVTFENLVIDANQQAQHGLKTFKISHPAGLLNNIVVRNALSHGILMEKNQGGVMRAVLSEQNGGAGIYCIDCNAMVIEETTARNNLDSGFVIDRQDFSGFMTLRRIFSEQNSGHGVLLKSGVFGFFFDGGWIADNKLDGVRLESFSGLIRDVVIKGAGDGSNRAIRLVPGGNIIDPNTGNAVGAYSGVATIYDNTFASSGSATYAVVEDETGLGNSVLFNNTLAPFSSLQKLSLDEKQDPFVVTALLNAKDFGAVGDGQNDDTTALQKAIDQAKGQSALLYIPRGIYKITQPLQLTMTDAEKLKIVGDWPQLLASSPMDAVLQINGAQSLVLRRLIFSGAGDLTKPSLATTTLTASNLGDNVLFDQISAGGAAQTGIMIQDSSGFTVRSISADSNKEIGLQCINCQAGIVDTARATNNGQGGFRFMTTQDFPSGMTLRSLWAEQNKGSGPGALLQQKSTTLAGGWFEANGGDGIIVDAPDVSLSGLRISGYGTDISRAIRLTKDAVGSSVFANSLHGAGAYNYRTVRDESGASGEITGNNYGWASYVRPLLIKEQCNWQQEVCVEKV